EAVFREAFEGLEPGGHLGQRPRIEVVVALTAARLLADQARAPQDLEVLGHRRPTEGEAARQVAHALGAAAQLLEDLAADGIGERGEDVDVVHVEQYMSDKSDASTISDAFDGRRSGRARVCRAERSVATAGRRRTRWPRRCSPWSRTSS